MLSTFCGFEFFRDRRIGLSGIGGAGLRLMEETVEESDAWLMVLDLGGGGTGCFLVWWSSKMGFELSLVLWGSSGDLNVLGDWYCGSSLLGAWLVGTQSASFDCVNGLAGRIILSTEFGSGGLILERAGSPACHMSHRNSNLV